uniref:Uncharacterized protein n=1 Tax=Clytia hemisphaerica TaxID=252671 RepID=A0A7M5VDR6_9CNID
SFVVSINVSGGCTLIFEKSYNLINIQLRKSSKQWNDLSPNIKVTVGTHHNLVIVDKLKLGSFYEFRGICLNQAGEVVIFKTKEDLQIKEIKEEDKLVVYGQNYVIQDFENLRADVIYVDYESIHFIFDKESDISEVIKVEIRSGDEKWDLVDENCYEFGDQLLDGAKNLMVGKLEENESYDMRITVRKFDDGVVVYIRKAIVTGELLLRFYVISS